MMLMAQFRILWSINERLGAIVGRSGISDPGRSITDNSDKWLEEVFMVALQGKPKFI